MVVCMCLCEREGGGVQYMLATDGHECFDSNPGERRECEHSCTLSFSVLVCVCLCMCVSVRERERERETHTR